MQIVSYLMIALRLKIAYSLQSLHAVSSTHLDVYKRQILYPILKHERSFSKWFKKIIPIAASITLIGSASLTAVSYTHLLYSSSVLFACILTASVRVDDTAFYIKMCIRDRYCLFRIPSIPRYHGLWSHLLAGKGSVRSVLARKPQSSGRFQENNYGEVG